ncbi:MAG: hypothetical protein HY098_03610 [Nitrospinae bacterium]|nr:hypothetical protein [Nitrospinota bacterium]
MTINETPAEVPTPKIPAKPAQSKPKTPAKPALSGKAKDLRSYLNNLRLTSKALCRTISSNIERDVIEAVELITTAPAKGGRKKNKKPDLAKATSILERLAVKPEKGRRGDLKRIEKAMRAVKEALSPDKNS